MNVKPVPLTNEVKRHLKPSFDMGNFDWTEIEQAIATYAACVWQVGDAAWIVTMVNTDNEIEILLCGGVNAWAVASPFEATMRSLPQHKGMTLRIDGRKAWKRVFKHWNCQEKDGGVLLTSRV